MIRTLGLAGLALAVALLPACQTTGSYEAPLVEAGVLPDEDGEAATAEAAPDEDASPAPRFSNAPGPDGWVENEGADLHYGGAVYRMSDLTPGQRPDIASDEAGLWMVMDKTETEVRTSGGYQRDTELQAYIGDVACRVAGQYCEDIRVYVVENPRFNAMMAPNGMMIIWTGLLLRVRNEAQLAAVLGHEIGHYLRRHSLQRMRDAIDKSNAAQFLQLAFAAAGVPIAGTVTNHAMMASIASFSRENEREADGYGLLLMLRAGYDPREAARVWEVVLRERDADPDDNPRPLFYASHPPSEERQRVLADLGAKIVPGEPGAAETGRESFLKVLLPRRAEMLREEVNLREYDRSLVLFDILAEDEEANPAELAYFRGELYRLRDSDGDEHRALESYLKSLELAGSPPPKVHRSLGLIHRRRGERAQAAAAFRRYLEANPEADDRLIVEDMIRKLSSS